MKYHARDIFTPQGLLSEVQDNPNLDFLMNIFNIPRAFGVSGFGGNWNVGKHSVATAFTSLLWSKFNHFHSHKTNRLVTLALIHDLHESVTGDILPMFKSAVTKRELDKIQKRITTSLGVKEDTEFMVDLKICDLTAFLYEVTQVSPSILNARKLKLAQMMAKTQQDILLKYAQEKGIKKEKINKFLQVLDL